MELEVHTADQNGSPVVVLSIDSHVSIIPSTDAVDLGNALVAAGIAHLKQLESPE